MERRAARRLRRQQLAKRRTAASQERMRIISQLAAKNPGSLSGSQSGSQASSGSSRKRADDDRFGANDEDWDVYKKIRKVNAQVNFSLFFLIVPQGSNNWAIMWNGFKARYICFEWQHHTVAA